MLAAWKYRDRGNWIQRLDPRARFIFMLCMLFSLIYFWDIRFLAAFLLIAILQFAITGITLYESRFAWLVLGPVMLMLILFTFLTGRSGTGVYDTETLVTTWHIGPLAINLTVEKTAFALAQAMRLPAIALFAMVIPYSYHPAHYGVMFRGLGLPDKFAYAMDLAFRLVPTLARDFGTTYDAQRARGYELERGKGGLVAQVRRTAPLLVPVVIQAIIGGEEIIDAMDLRAFGVQPRTWLNELTYTRRDKLVIAASVFAFILSTALSVTGYGDFWVPDFIARMAP
jgi:energy-coupling factor transport system permease protein